MTLDRATRELAVYEPKRDFGYTTGFPVSKPHLVRPLRPSSGAGAGNLSQQPPHLGREFICWWVDPAKFFTDRRRYRAVI